MRSAIFWIYFKVSSLFSYGLVMALILSSEKSVTPVTLMIFTAILGALGSSGVSAAAPSAGFSASCLAVLSGGHGFSRAAKDRLKRGL